MTDYLALALEQDEEEREGLAAALEPGPGLPYPKDGEALAETALKEPHPSLLSQTPEEDQPETPVSEDGAGGGWARTVGAEEAKESAAAAEATEETGEETPESLRPFPTVAAGEEAGVVPALRFGEVAPAALFAGKPSAPPTGERPTPPLLPGGKATTQVRQWEERSERVLNALEDALGLAAPRVSRKVPAAGGERTVRDTDFLSPGGEGRETAALGLLTQVRQAQRGSGFVQSQRRSFTVTLPESGPSPAPWSAEEFDRSCERDARRYGGSFALY